jgi:hypothetical protein
LATRAEVFERAAEILDRRGWTQFMWQDEDGSLCVTGAIGVAAMELGAVELHPYWKPDWSVSIILAVDDFLSLSERKRLQKWNDSQCDPKNKHRAVAKLAQMASEERAKEREDELVFA